MKEKDSLVVGAWNLAEPSRVTWYPLAVPRAWREQVSELAKLCSKAAYYAPPIRDLDAPAMMCLPAGTVRFNGAWFREEQAWFGSPSKCDLTFLILTVRDWIRVEYGGRLPADIVNGTLATLRDEEWQWGEATETWLGRPAADPLQERYQFALLPQWAAARFLEDPHLQLGGMFGMPQHNLQLYRQITLDGAELLTWPPVPVPVDGGDRAGAVPAMASVIIRFTAQTVPGRSTPLLYHHVSLRRFWARPLTDDRGLTSEGWVRPTVLMGMRHGLLPSQAAGFTLVPLRWWPEDRRPVWPKALENLLAVIQQVPSAQDVAARPLWNLSTPEGSPRTIQAAVVFNTQMGKNPIANGGVSVGDLAKIDHRLACHPHLRLKRIGELNQQGQFRQKNAVVVYAPPHAKATKRGVVFTGKKSVPMHQPDVVRSAVAQAAGGKLRQIRILFRSVETHDALLDEVVRKLGLRPSSQPDWYEGPTGKTEIVGQRIDDELWAYLTVERGSAQQRRRQRTDEIKRRVEEICSSIPPAPLGGISAALVEIPSKPQGGQIRETDPKLAWRIGLGRQGYVNQHIHSIVRPDRDAARCVAAVAELWRHLGVVPAPIFTEAMASQLPDWLMTTFVLRRTRKTGASNRAMKAIFALRVHARTGAIEVSTPSLMTEGKWISYREGLLSLLGERWERPEVDSSGNGTWAAQRKEEQEALLALAVHAIKGTLASSTPGDPLPRVLWLTEAINVRESFPVLSNAGINRGDLEKHLLTRLTLSEQERLGIVRVRRDHQGEVPSVALDNEVGGRRTGLYRWDVPQQERPVPVFLSLMGLSTAFQGMLPNGMSRLDDGTRENRSARPLEVAVLHAGKTMNAEDLALITHFLRTIYPYFETDRTGTKLPFPMPLAERAGEEYAVDAADGVDSGAPGADEG